jgi:GTPase SAR1 family protein
MGNCGQKISDEEREAQIREKAISKELRLAQEKDAQIIKLLLLGAGESGKSTIFKQMKILYGVGFSDDDRAAMAPVIYNNVICGMKILIENAQRLGHTIVANDKAIEFMEVSDEAVIDAAVGELVTTLWADTGIQDCYDDRAQFQLFDSFSYYATKRVGDISKDDYLPNLKDVLQSRVRTSGIVEEKYVIDGVEFVMYDVGGQRNERKKWIHCFDNVTAVIFVAAISEYDQVLYEDNTQNRIIEAVNLFEEICNSRWFVQTSMILFLNKKDLFEEKFPKVNLSEHFPEYTGGDDNMDAAKEFMLDLFTRTNQHPDEKEIYHHITCATDTSNVETVFNACKDIILKGNLKGSGFMD